MRVFIRITLVVCVYLVISVQLAKCEELELSGSVEEADQDGGAKSLDNQAEKKDGKGMISGTHKTSEHNRTVSKKYKKVKPKPQATGGSRRATTQASTNTTRDSQLLSVLAARRRQLLHGRLATHINTLASLAHKSNRNNTTFAQLEVRDVGSSVIKRITFDNSSNETTPKLQLITTDGTREIRQDLKPHEIRHLFVPKVLHDGRSRAGFINNRRKEINITKTGNENQDIVTESTGVVYIPPEKLEGLDKEIEIDPEEEFQVDESNHGLYLLNYSDTDNVTINHEFNKTIKANETKESNSIMTTTPSPISSTLKDGVISESQETFEQPHINVIANSTNDKNLKRIKVENDKEKLNTTLFMSDEMYNHFRPLETDLPAEDMAPFIYFGQKLGGQVINDNLTNSPSLSASTKSVNFIVAPPERRKFNSRYSATEKYQNSSVDEEEINEEMDVSVVKNIIEKNKVRNTVKGAAPARSVGLVNAYRKYTTVSTLKPPNIAQLNVTEPIISFTPSSIDKNKTSNRYNGNATLSKDTISINSTTNLNDTVSEGNSNVNTANKVSQTKSNTTTTTPRNYTRTYTSSKNLRRRPARVTTASNTESFNLPLIVNTTTEKASTLVYTAVVTSVSITSSMKGHNKTDIGNSTVEETEETIDNSTIPKAILLNVTEGTHAVPSSSPLGLRPYKAHRIRIRTTTTESSINSNPPSTPLVYVHRATDSPVPTELSTKTAVDLKNEAAAAKISERLASLYGKPEPENTTASSTIRPKNILKRRRPTTTTSTTTTTTTTTPTPTIFFITDKPSTISSWLTPTTEVAETSQVTENTYQPFVVTSRTSSESSSKPLLVPANSGNMTNINGTKANENLDKEDNGTREEVVIEAEKTYTASYVLAGLGFLPVAAIIVFVLRSVMNKKTKEIDTEYEGYFDDGDIKKESPIIPVARPPMPTPTKPDQKWEFPRNKLRLQTLLGQGNFGQVWKAEADDLTGHDGMTRLVAVKSIKETASQKEKQELLHEIYIMQKIGTHPNVVTLLACCTEQEPYLLIMEYVMCGKLLTYLRERRSRPDRFSGSGALTSRDLTVFAYCVARGMDYIASKGIVHRDLAARNVLVDHNKLCKIADFGMSREVSGNEERARQRHALPVRWMAPEALLYNVYNHETDVWAYGILLWEIVTLGSTPYAAMTGREVLAAVTEGYRLERPPHCKPQLYRAMHSCWHSDPSQRPSFASLKSQLAELLDNEPVEGNYVDLDSFYQESSVYSDPSAIIHDEEGLSAEYDRERRVFRDLTKGPAKYDNRGFNFRDEELRKKFGIGTPRMGGFGIRDVSFNGDFNDRQFNDSNFNERNFNDKNFSDKSFNDRNFGDKTFNDKNFTDRNFGDKNFNANFSDLNERKDGKLSTSSFHRDRERENPLVSRNSFNGFPRLGTRDTHFQLMADGRNNRVSEFECDI